MINNPANYQVNPYVQMAKEYCSSPEGIAHSSSLAKRAKESSDLLEQQMFVSYEAWHSQINI
jgi:hypothetical protein